MSSFLSSYFCDSENCLLSNDVIVIRNKGEGHEGLIGCEGAAGEPKGRADQVGGPIQLDFGSVSEFRTNPH